MTKNKETPLDPDTIVDEVYYSCDVEADGPIPGPFSMSSFGLVACAYRTRSGIIVDLDIDAKENCYYAELKPISDQFIPEASAVAGLDRDELYKNGKTPEQAMREAVDFIDNRTREFGANSRAIFVAYPLGYDWMFMYWYFINFAGVSPFGHSGALDMKSYFASKADFAIRRIGKRGMPANLKSKRFHSHNALDDAREQGELCRNLLRWGGK